MSHAERGCTLCNLQNGAKIDQNQTVRLSLITFLSYVHIVDVITWFSGNKLSCLIVTIGNWLETKDLFRVVPLLGWSKCRLGCLGHEIVQCQ